MSAWHHVGQDGIASDATDDLHDAELPEPTFHSSANVQQFERATRAVIPTRSKQSAAPNSNPGIFAARVMQSNDNDTIPPAWVKLLTHLQASRDRKCKENIMLQWANLLENASPVLPVQNLGILEIGGGALFPRNNIAMGVAADATSDEGEYSQESDGQRAMVKCGDCGMFKRREKMRTVGTCLKCSRRGGGGEVARRRGSRRGKESPTSTHSELEEEDWDHSNLC